MTPLSIALLIAATAVRPGGDMRDVSTGFAGSTVVPSTVTLDPLPYDRTVTCGSFTITGTYTGSLPEWSASPSEETGTCVDDGGGTFYCVVSVSPDAAGEGVETITIGDQSVTLGFYVAGAHTCLLSQNTDGDYNATRADLDPIAAWENVGSSGLNLTQGTGTAQPTFRTSIVNGQPIVRCDGGDYVGASTASDWTYLHASGGSTVSAVVSMTNSGLNTIAATSTGSGTNRGMGWRTNTTAAANYYMSDGVSLRINATSSNNVFTTNTFNDHTVTLRLLDTPDMTGYINGTSVVTGNAAAFSSSAPANAVKVCSRGDGTSSFMTGDIFSILMYQSVLTATQSGINIDVTEWALGGSLPVTP